MEAPGPLGEEGGSKRDLSQGQGERVGRWLGGREAEALQVASMLLIITPLPIALALLSLPLISVHQHAP